MKKFSEFITESDTTNVDMGPNVKFALSKVMHQMLSSIDNKVSAKLLDDSTPEEDADILLVPFCTPDMSPDIIQVRYLNDGKENLIRFAREIIKLYGHTFGVNELAVFVKQYIRQMDLGHPLL